jgi:hypothetical protein
MLKGDLWGEGNGMQQVQLFFKNGLEATCRPIYVLVSLHRIRSPMTPTPSPSPNTTTVPSSRGVTTAILLCFSILLQVGSAFTASAASEKQIFLKGPQYYGVGPINMAGEFLQGGAIVNEDPNTPKMLLVGYGGGPLVINRAILCFDLQDFAKELKAAKKINLIFNVVWVNNSVANSIRQLEISWVKTEAATLSNDEVMSGNVEKLGIQDIPAVGYEINTYSVDLTETIHKLLEKGEKRIVLRLRDVLVEQSGGVQDQSDAIVIGTVKDKKPFIQFD